MSDQMNAALVSIWGFQKNSTDLKRVNGVVYNKNKNT